MSSREKPIGVFDSGIGGLTVLREIMRTLPSENIVYLGDTARVPYGIRSPETVTRYSFENARFLCGRDIKLLVVACNTVSSISLVPLRKTVPVPVIGVIDPGARAAVSSTRKRRVGIIGTEATVRSNAYRDAIHALDPLAQVFSKACPLFVPLVEEGWTEGPVARMVAEKYLTGILSESVDTMVLGCTHYPLLKNTIREIAGEGVMLIDSAVETAREVRDVLRDLSLLGSREGQGSHEFFVTDSPEKFVQVGERFLGHGISSIRKISLETEG